METNKRGILLELISIKRTKYHEPTLISLKRTLKEEIIEKLALEESKSIEVILRENPSVEDFFKTFGLSFKKLYQVFVERKKAGENLALGNYTSFKRKLALVYSELREEILKGNSTEIEETKAVESLEKPNLKNANQTAHSTAEIKEQKEESNKTIKEANNAKTKEELKQKSSLKKSEPKETPSNEENSETKEENNKTIKQVENKTTEQANNDETEERLIEEAFETTKKLLERIYLPSGRKVEEISKKFYREHYLKKEYYRKIVELYKKYRYKSWEEFDLKDFEPLPPVLRKALLYYLLIDDEGVERGLIGWDTYDKFKEFFRIGNDEMASISRICWLKVPTVKKRFNIVVKAMETYFPSNVLNLLELIMVPLLDPIRKKLNETVEVRKRVKRYGIETIVSWDKELRKIKGELKEPEDEVGIFESKKTTPH